jgi:Fe-S-cluster containining protein
MRKNHEGKGFACAIYPTRPTICREFRCYRMLIHHPSSGETRGKVIGINELRTHDENPAALRPRWASRIDRRIRPDPYSSIVAMICTKK